MLAKTWTESTALNIQRRRYSMSYLIKRVELQAILCIERSKSYLLQSDGTLPKPIIGLGRNKLFDLKSSLEAAHRALGLPPPDAQLVENHWAAIVASRLQNH
jgi:hypothetical protein